MSTFIPLATVPANETPANAGRRRTPAQLQRKRELDKASQKLKRKQHKSHVEKLETSLRDAREEIHHLRAKLQDLELSFSLVAGHGRDIPGHSISAVNQLMQTKHPVSTEIGNESLQPANKASSLRAEFPIGRCRCAPQAHKSYSDCFEETLFAILIKIDTQLTPSKPIPAIPEITDVLFLRPPGNPVTKVMYKFLRNPKLPVAVQCAAYLLAYRLLRYRFFPSIQTYRDIPEWLHFTDAQNNVPHPLYIDFVIFPRLRHAMALGLVNVDAFREAFEQDAANGVSINWPASKNFLATNNSAVTFTPEFMQHVFQYHNWSMSLDFAEKYPQIAALVTVRD
ncbi:hypothetical protein EDB81DRAFT_901875 [Dactylonectria macrodidyma]|uniref:BZIP domain-containing protein n=1 Tax=Dactylonectria macrodidyma TaxID=307937 RepID=A0A9P9EGM3_9HYPO|nr:hypothetical protein EDB81DRAFT_901875 [Dactylonectria macrodidyma]